MGFNKRILKKETLKKIYQNEGYKGLYDYITKPDALYVGDCKDVVNIIYSNECDTKKSMEIKKIL